MSLAQSPYPWLNPLHLLGPHLPVMFSPSLLRTLPPLPSVDSFLYKKVYFLPLSLSLCSGVYRVVFPRKAELAERRKVGPGRMGTHLPGAGWGPVAKGHRVESRLLTWPQPVTWPQPLGAYEDPLRKMWRTNAKARAPADSAFLLSSFRLLPHQFSSLMITVSEVSSGLST